MEIRGLIDEDIVNYKKASMYLVFPYCSFKCDKECGRCVCQNSPLLDAHIIDITPEEVCERYLKNSITSAIVCAGLEPFDSRFDLLTLVNCLRVKNNCDDDIVIYTGYTEEELNNPANTAINFTYSNLLDYSNIIIKFGRYIPDMPARYDDILGVYLASDNQYAKKVS